MRKIKVRDKKHLLAIIGCGMLLANSITLIYTFFNAYFNPTKSTIIYINAFGEANLEAVLLPVTLLLGFYCIWFLVKDVKKEKKGEKKYE